MATWTKPSARAFGSQSRVAAAKLLLALLTACLAGGMWRVQPVWAGSPHTITIDGTNDFAANEDVPGTSGSTWYFTWDANNFYFGLTASDVAANSATKWAWLYLDTDPQQTPLSGLGTSTGVNYNTQTPGLPFRADFHFRWRTDNTYVNMLDWNNGTSSWTDDNTGSGNFGISAFQSGTFVEFKIPRSSLGNPSQVYVCGAMINEQGGTESTFFLVPSSNGPDGYDKDFANYLGFPLVDNIAPDLSGHENTYPVASVASGNYSSGATWTGGVAPHSNSNVFIQNGHTVTLDATGDAKHFTIISSGTFGNSSSALNIANNGLFANNGTFNGSDGTVNFAGTGTISGTTTFNNVVLAGGVNFGAAATVNGTLQINTGGFVSTNAPTYGSAATLKYNSGGTYGVSTEWTAASSSGPGVPQNVQISNSTTLTLGSSARTAKGNLTIDSGSALTSTSGTLTLGGDFTKNGTFTHNSGNVTFNKNGNQTISGTGTTTFNTLTLNMGTSNGNVLEAQSVIALAGSTNPLAITNGTFKLSSSSTITPFTNGTGATIPASGGFWLNGGTINAGNFSWTLSGLLRLSSGTLGIGTGAGNSLIYNTGSTITIEGGALNISGRLSNSQTTTYSQSAGTVTVVTNSSTSTTRAGFEMTSGSSFTMSGGTIVVQRATSNASDYLNLAATNNVTGGTLQIGDANSPNAAVIRINSTAPVHHLTVNNSTSQATKPAAQLVTNGLTVKGDINVQSGTTLNANSLNINLAGNWTNSGTFTPGTGTVTMNGASGQTMSGSTFNNLTINNASGVTLLTDETVSGTLTLTNGNITTGSNKMIIASGGTVSRTSGHVVGNLQKNFATGSNVARTYEIGAGSDYTPVNVTITSVSTAGDVTAKSTSGDHSSIGTSTLDATKSVNRNWALTSDGALGFTTYDATFNFVAGDLDGGANTNNLIVGKLDAGTWTYPTVGTRTATSTQAAGMTSFSDFQLAEPQPAAGVTITESGGSTDIAEGGATDTYTIVLNSTPSANVTISFNTGSQISAISAVTFTPANALTPQTITVSAVDDGLVEGAHTGMIAHTASSADANYNGISITSVTANITDNDVAVTANAGNDATGCFGATFNLNGTASGGDGTYTFAWTVQSGPNTSSAQFNNAALEDPTFTPTLAGTYVLRFTVDDGVNPTAFDDVQIIVNALPTATVSGTTTICAGASATLSAALTGTGPWDLTWSDGFTQNGITTSPAMRSVSPSTTTTYTVTNVTGANSCSNTGTGSAIITVNPLPTATVSGTTTICAGASATLNAALTGTGPWNLTWSDGFTQNGVTTSPATRSVSPATTTTYTVTTVSDANCTGTASGSAIITVNPAPTATVSGDATICAGSSATLSAALTGTGPWNLTWSDGFTQNGVTTSPATRSVSPASTTTYTVTNVTDANSCSNTGTGSAVITVTPGITVTFNPVGPFCLNAAAVDLSSAVSPAGGTFSGPGISGNMFNPASAGVGTHLITYSVTSGVCMASASQNIVVRALPTATVSGTTSICPGASTTLSAALTGTGPWNLTWSDGFTQTGVTTSPATRSVSPAVTTTYTVTAVSDANCTGTSSGSAVITVKTLPTATVSGTAEICAGASATLTAALTGTAPWNLTWSDGFTQNGVTTSPATRSVSPATTTTYTVTTVTANGCSNTGTGSATITVNPNPVANAGLDQSVTSGQTVAIGGSPTASGGTPPYSYSWSPATGLDNPNASNPNATVTSTTTYTVTVTDAKSCVATDQVKITVLTSSLGRVFLADKLVKFKQNKTSDGDIHSNNDIEFDKGAPGTHTGNLTAVDDISIGDKNTIIGDATAGDDVDLSGSASVTGTIIEDANVAVIPLPSLSFSAGGADVTVPKNGSVTLAPGSYDEVEVKDKGTLNLSAGDYFMNELTLKTQARLSINVGGGSVNINVVSELSFGEKAQVVVSGGPTDRVTFSTRQDDDVEIGKNAIIRGTIIAPEAEVHFAKESKIKGAVTAESITLEALVKAQHHNSVAPFPKESDESEVEESEVASNQSPVNSYQLEQNYPNPFSQIPRFAGNPSTTISFALPQESEVTLVIYNMTGQMVRRLVGGQYRAGRHSAVWDAKDDNGAAVASGVYIYVLRAGNFVAQKKLLLMK